MGQRSRIWLLITVVVVVLAAATTYGVLDRLRWSRQQQTPPAASQQDLSDVAGEPHIVFRHTGLDSEYGKVAMVRLADPSGPRAFTEVSCDRVAAWAQGASCLVTGRGVVTRFESVDYDARWRPVSTHPLPGIPSRTQVSPSGDLVATTAFVTGHSYMTLGFSTETVVREHGRGKEWGNVEDFTLVLDGERAEPVDRNVWGVTFVDDSQFYATVGSDSKTWLVQGDLKTRTLTSIARDAECPSISPDKKRVAFKVKIDGTNQWSLAVMDLASNQRTELGDGPRGIDDQVAWLNDDTLIYGLPRPDEPGVSDIWEVEVTPGASPTVFIEEAWSPSVVLTTPQ